MKGTNGQDQEPNRWVDAPYACAWLGVSKAALYIMVCRGELRAYRLGKRRLRFRMCDLEKALVPIDDPS